jgi:hypothetical protein
MSIPSKKIPKRPVEDIDPISTEEAKRLRTFHKENKPKWLAAAAAHQAKQVEDREQSQSSTSSSSDDTSRNSSSVSSSTSSTTSTEPQSKSSTKATSTPIIKSPGSASQAYTNSYAEEDIPVDYEDPEEYYYPSQSNDEDQEMQESESNPIGSENQNQLVQIDVNTSRIPRIDLVNNTISAVSINRTQDYLQSIGIKGTRIGAFLGQKKTLS